MAGPSVTVEMSADELKMLRSLQKVMDKNRELEQSLDSAGKKGKKAGGEISQGMSEAEKDVGSLTSNIGAMIGKIGLVAAAMTAVNETFAKVRDNMDKAKTTSERLFDARIKLSQVATNPADRARLESESLDVARQMGIDPSLAMSLRFMSRSTGRDSSFQSVAQWAQYLDPKEVQRIAELVPNSFPDSPVTVEQSLAATFAAARQSVKDFEGMSPMIPTAAGGARMTGATPDETIAALAVLSGVFKDAEAGQRLSIFGSTISGDERFRSGGLIRAVEQMRQMPQAQREALIGGSSEARQAYSALDANLEAVKQQLAIVREAIANPAGQMRALESNVQSDPFAMSVIQARRQRVRSELMNEESNAGGAFKMEQITNAMTARQQELGYSPGAVAFGQALSTPYQWLGMGEHAIGAQALGTSLYSGGYFFDSRVKELESTGIYGTSRPLSPGRHPDSSGSDVRRDAMRGAMEAIESLGRYRSGPSTLAQPDVDK